MKAFTIDFDGDNFKNDPLLLKCVARSKEFFGPSNFTIYTKNDDIVKEALEKYKDIYEMCKQKEENLCFFCDFVRIYILSKQRDTIYIDFDMYIIDTELHELEKYFRDNYPDGCCKNSSFCIMYSGTSKKSEKLLLNTLDELYSEYKKKRDTIYDYDFLSMGKKNIIAEYNQNIPNFVHFGSYFFNDNIKCFLYSDKIKFGEDAGKKLEDFLKKRCVLFINSKKYFFRNSVFNLHNVVTFDWLKKYIEKDMTRFKPGRKLIKVEEILRR